MIITAVVPVFNEEQIINELCKRTTNALEKISDDYQLILVDDGSSDKTWERIKQETNANKKIKAIKFSRNFGQHAAITAGLDYADSDWVVVMDGDLQDRPEAIPDMYKKAQEGYDVVFVEREDRPISVSYRIAQTAFYSTLKFLANTEYDPRYGNFSIISRKVVNTTHRFREHIRFYGGMVFWSGFKRASITQKHDQRYAGTASYNLYKRLKLAFDIIITHSERPLYLAIILGLLAMVGSFLYGLYILISAIFFDFTVQGWASLMVSLYFLGGIIMSLLGLVGLYVGKIFTQVKDRPLYVTEELLND